MHMRRLVALLFLTTVTAACGDAAAPDAAGPASPATASVGSSPTAMSPDDRAVEALASVAAGDGTDFEWGDEIFHFLTDDGRVLDLSPWTACLGNGCWDGAPGLGGPIPSVGAPDALYFAFDYPDWRFHWVSFHPVGDHDDDGRIKSVRATAVTDRIFRIDAPGLHGEWQVDVFGRGGGDAVTSVRWTMPPDEDGE